MSRKKITFASHRFPKRPGRARGLKGNAVKSGNSSRCCESRPQGLFRCGILEPLVLRDREGAASGDKSEDLPCAIGCLLLRRKGAPEVVAGGFSVRPYLLRPSFSCCCEPLRLFYGWMRKSSPCFAGSSCLFLPARYSP